MTPCARPVCQSDAWNAWRTLDFGFQSSAIKPARELSLRLQRVRKRPILPGLSEKAPDCLLAV
jgi:hypothetical protein